MKLLPFTRYLSKLDFENSSFIVEDILFDPGKKLIILKGVLIQHRQNKQLPIGVYKKEIHLSESEEIFEKIKKSFVCPV